MKRILWPVGLLLVLLVAGAAVAQQPMSTFDSLAMQMIPAAYDRAIDPNLFIIRPGEQIRVTFLQTSLLALELEVSPEGQIIDPILGAVDVSGMTLAQVREKLIGPLRSRYNVKDMVITVGAPRSIGISVTGAVRNPGFYRAYSSQRVTDAIALAGGVLSNGSTRRIVLTGGPSTIQVDLDRALFLGDDQTNPFLYAGYHVIVPARTLEVVQVIGEVLQPRAIELMPGDNLETLLALAGGPTRQADTENIRLLGETGRDIRQPNMLKAGDIIRIPPANENFQEGIALFGEVKSPGRFFYQAPMTLDQLIKLANGTTENANTSRITIFRLAETDQSMELNGERYPVEASGADFLNTQLRPMDSVVVPRKLGWVKISGLVRSPGLLPFIDGKDASYYISAAGGFLPEADTKQVGLTSRVSRVHAMVSVNTGVRDGDEIVAEPQMVSAP